MEGDVSNQLDISIHSELISESWCWMHVIDQDFALLSLKRYKLLVENLS